MSTFVYLNLVQIRILWQQAATDKVGTKGNLNNCVSLIQLQVLLKICRCGWERFYRIGFLILTAISSEVKLFSALFQDTSTALVAAVSYQWTGQNLF